MDSEKVIRAVDSCFDYWLDKHGYLSQLELERVQQIKADALALLKEQDNCENCAIAIEDRQLIVRCKDCKYWSAERINDYNKCRRWINVGVKNFATMGDWFCADGEKE